MENRKTSTQNESDVFGKVLFRYLPYWPLFLLLLTVGMAMAWLYMRYATPYYQIMARVLIKDENKGAEDSKAVEMMNLFSSKKLIENEVEVIQSLTLMMQVVKNLHLYASVNQEGQLRDRPAYVESPVKIEALSPDSLREVERVRLQFDQSNETVYVDGGLYPIDKWVSTPWGTLRFIKNKYYYDNAQPDPVLYFSLKKPKLVAISILNRLKVTTTSRSSTILNLNLRDEVPQRGIDIVNELMSVYNKAMIMDKNILASNTLNFVEERLANVEHELDSIERLIQQYRYKKGAIDIGTQGKLFLENVSSNDHHLSEINMQLAVLDQVEEYVNKKNHGNGIVPSTLGVSDPVLSQLVNNLYTEELEFEKLKKTTAENNPMLIAVTDQIAKIKPSIMENIQSQRRGLIASRNNLMATNNSYSSMLRMLPKMEKELIDINREQQIKNEIYTFLLQKREETTLSHASTVSDSRIVDKAESSEFPISPKGKIVYFSAGLLSILIGLVIVGSSETLNRKILFRHEIERATTIPIIGEIVSEPAKNHIVVGPEQKTFIAEHFRRLRSSLAFAGINSKHKRIMITSSISGEGKSFVAMNLALSLALAEKKVLLLDLDLNMNGPSITDKLNMPQHEGVTQYLLGQSRPEEIIQKSVMHELMFLIGTGQTPRNPTEILMNGRIEGLLNYLDMHFDYIIIDTAPVGLVTDAYVVTPFCDATLYVVRHGYTPKVFVQRIDENNQINPLARPAIVFNGVQSRGFGSKNYGYGYGYGYIHKDRKHQKTLRISQQQPRNVASR